jgi:hypothetical protein
MIDEQARQSLLNMAAEIEADVERLELDGPSTAASESPSR